jgi:thymidine kinase
MLNLILGPMYSGKTSLLISRFERYSLGGKRCLVIKYGNDKRYNEEHVCTHNEIKLKAIQTLLLGTISSLIENYDVILIDEIQFYDDAASVCDEWANQKKTVECYGLNGDFRRQPFEQISLLIPKADKIQHLTAIDRKSGNEAPFTFRTNDDQQQELIGGKGLYVAVSRGSYYKMKNQKNRAEMNQIEKAFRKNL